MAKRGLYANIQAKRKRIKAGSGETMRKKGAGIRALKKKAPQVAKAMGYKKGGKAKRIK